ncbi:MAG: hypothetical protein DRJ97_04830 [Thermoprotei archaeon]|nr:MAG: hypothetical protein DRJ97_04830 [Thermoprotei archaeon]
MLIAIPLLAFLAACLSSVIGIGGGFLYVPLLNLLASLPMEYSVGTSKLTVTFTAYVATASYIKRGMVKVKAPLAMSVASTAGSLLGVLFIGWAGGFLIKLIFSLVALWAGVSVLRGRTLRTRLLQGKRYWGAPLFFVVGFLAGSTGVGGGFAYTPLFNIVLDFPVHQAITSSLLVIAVTSTATSIGHVLAGQVNLLYAPSLIIGASAGSFLGTRLLPRLSERTLRGVLGSLLLLIALAMLLNLSNE